MTTKTALLGKTMALALFVFIWSIPGIAGAHCDTLDGPVVTTARAALEKGDVTPLLKWVRKEDEKDIQELFNKTLIVRKQGKDAKELADMYFFETLVRIHRAGEGAPYTGLKKEPAEPVIMAADKALQSGSPDDLVKLISDDAAKGIRERFEHAKETRKHADESIGAGREFVEAYVTFTHYVERLHSDALIASGHGKASEEKTEGHHRH